MNDTVFEESIMKCLIKALSIAGLVCSVALAKPNVVFILADDLGIGGLQGYGTEWLEKAPCVTAANSFGVSSSRRLQSMKTPQV